MLLLGRIAKAEQIRHETFFIIRRAEESAVAGYFRHWLRGTADHRTAARLCFGDRPAESLEARREHECAGRVVECLEQRVIGRADLENACADPKRVRLLAQIVAELVADEYELPRPFVRATCEDPQNGLAIFAAQI